MNNQPDEITGNNFETLSNSANLVQGNSNLQVTILAFLDYQCTEYKSWYLNTYPEIKEKLIDAGKTNLKFLNAGSVEDNSLLAAEAVYCADEQGKFPEYQKNLLLAQQELNGSWIKPSKLESNAQEINLNMQEFSRCLGSDKYEKKTKDNVKESKKIGIEKTPVFIIFNSDGKHHIIKGGVSFEIFETIVNSMNI